MMGWRLLVAGAWFGLLALVPVCYFHGDQLGWLRGIGIPCFAATVSGCLLGSKVLDDRWVNSGFEAVLVGAAVTVAAQLACAALWAVPADSLWDYLLKLAGTFLSLYLLCGITFPTFCAGAWALWWVDRRWSLARASQSAPDTGPLSPQSE